MQSLRNPVGGPSVRTRVVAALVVIGLVILTAPIVVLPLVHAFGRALF
ncbi:MAG: hypothetical protein ABR520_04495 [Mycobacteriales bacterium]|nr:hypothetical protein [Frankia sp.]